jgi:hypothetical protein
LRPGRHEVLEILRDVLVVDIQLIFERVEFGFVEHRKRPEFPFRERGSSLQPAYLVRIKHTQDLG